MPPVLVVAKITVVVDAPLQTTWLVGWSTCPGGFTSMVASLELVSEQTLELQKLKHGTPCCELIHELPRHPAGQTRINPGIPVIRPRYPSWQAGQVRPRYPSWQAGQARKRHNSIIGI